MVQNESFDDFAQKMAKAYSSIKIGDPLDPSVLVGPLHSKVQVQAYVDGIEEAKKQGGKVLVGGKVLTEMGGNYVQPTIIEIDAGAPIV